MTKDFSQQMVLQLESVTNEYKRLKATEGKYGYSDDQEKDILMVTTMARAAVERACPVNSAYCRQLEAILANQGKTGQSYIMDCVIGVVEALISDLKSGYIEKIEELIHGELFGDFLEMARYLLDEGYTDAAAVIAGSSLEAHLRQLCQKNNISTEVQVSSGFRPKKAEQMNSDLATASVYEKLDQKNVTAWLDLRNKAAHGEYDKYTKEQVLNMVTGIRDFLTRNPA